METFVKHNTLVTRPINIPLHTLVNHLVEGVLPKTTANKSFMINEIPSGLNLGSNVEMIAAVLNNLFTTVATHAMQSCIRISAKLYGTVIWVQLEDKSGINAYTIAHSLQAAQPIAERIGGYLGVASHRENETTVVFSFPIFSAAS